jgi:ABC-type nitrate/sulfonate/bicarbonate transport system substrate-binding protein
MANQLTTIRAITFGGGYNLPAWVAQRKGYFERHGIEVQLTYTPDSVYLMKSLIEGEFDLALTAIDNLIAYQEGQGEAQVSVEPDLVAFMGLDSGFLDLVAAPGITSVAQLRGKDIAVDALTTGFAFVLREMIARAGLTDADVNYVRAGGSPKRLTALLEGRHAATLLPTPFALQAAERGYVILGSGKALLGSYQGRCAFGSRKWIARNHDAVISLMRAYGEAMDWIFDSANDDEAQSILMEQDAGLTPPLARTTYALFTDPGQGLFRNLRLDMEGIRVVLELRSKFAAPAQPLTDPMKYIDLDLHRVALGAA